MAQARHNDSRRSPGAERSFTADPFTFSHPVWGVGFLAGADRLVGIRQIGLDRSLFLPYVSLLTN
jgi:hypothetical protein